MPSVERQIEAAALFDKLEPIRQIQTQTVIELDSCCPRSWIGRLRGSCKALPVQGENCEAL